jgi:hypothetical protein
MTHEEITELHYLIEPGDEDHEQQRTFSRS